MDQIFIYADNAGKPFNASEEEVIRVLKQHGENIAAITQKDVDEFIEAESAFIEEQDYTPEDLQTLVDPNYFIWMYSGIDISDVIHDTIIEKML